MRSSLRLAGLAPALCLLAPAALSAAPEKKAQPVAVTVKPSKLDEGRPARLRVSFENTSSRPLLLLELGAKVNQPNLSRSEVRDWTQRTKGVRVDGEVVTLTLTATDDPGPEARAPRPPVVAGLEGRPYRKLQVLLPGRKVSLGVSFVPRHAACRVTATYKAIPHVAGGELYAIQDVQRWNPGAEPTKPGQPMLMPRGTGFSVELTRWEPWGGQATGEVLVGEEQLRRLGAYEGVSKERLTVEPADFSQLAASQRAKASGVEQAVRLADGRWVLQSKSRWWLVGAKDEVRSGEGNLYLSARDLASLGRFGLDWYGTKRHKAFAEELRMLEIGHPTKGGLGLSIEVDAETLVPFLDLLSRYGGQITRQGLRF